MQGLHKYKWIIILSTLVFIILLLVIWLKPQAKSDDVSVNKQVQNDAQQNLNQNILAAQTPENASLQSLSQQDTEINCQLAIDSSNRLIVNENTKNCFEYFITQYGEKSIEQLKADFIKYAKNTYKEPLLSQLLNLWDRYMQYRTQLGNIEKPTVDPESSAYYRQVFNSMHQLKKRFFSDYEIEGLFGQESIYDQYTLDRMDVHADKTLTEKQKAEKLQALLNALPQDWQDNLKQLNQLEDLRNLTAEIKERGGSSEEIRQMRLNLVGPEATQRLEKLDTDRTEWKSRVTQYLDQRETINDSSMGSAAKQQAIEKLRQQHFKNPQEQIRVETFENVKDQGGRLPFAD